MTERTFSMIPLTGIQPRPEYDTYRTLLADRLMFLRTVTTRPSQPRISQICNNKTVTVALSCFPQRRGLRASKFWVYKGARRGLRASKFWVYKGAVGG
eukprot:gene7909-1121_t